ncbi:PREDICTED: uncharacterized protein LOC107337909 isoform X3 [Acropora digitifera]|uniref:uncharacterized protein LOC107337909 isoform X3 n=1 Tax=Acropora digitifera TaxID=70779 RepID=UPI00077A3350|nr:PREDICTED: uncharacterized protein LOC107337909 isoform X3 [Acropora digitifera]
MAQSKVAVSIGMISMLLPNGLGTSITGSGCIVNLNVKGEEKGNWLITTTQVITKNDLLFSDHSVVVEFFDIQKQKLVTFSLDNVADDVDVLPGRVLEGTGQSLKDISFLVISMEKHVRGNVFTKLLKKFKIFHPLTRDSVKGQSLACAREDDETLKQNISARQILCHVMWNKKDDEVATELYCLEFEGDECTEFALTPPLDNNRLDYALRKLTDFNIEQRPRGAPLFSKIGEFVGMLAFEESEERRFFPLFLPTVEMPTSVSSKEKFDNTCAEVTEQLVIKVSPEKPEPDMSDFDDTEGNGAEENQENQNGASSNKNPSQRPGVESQGNCLTISGVQGSGTSALSPWQLRGSSSESPQSLPIFAKKRNTSSDGNSLQSKQLEPHPVNEQIPTEGSRTSFAGESTESDDDSSTDSAPTSLDYSPSSKDRISDESPKDKKVETSMLPCHIQQQSTFNSDGTSTVDDDQLSGQIDSLHEYNATDGQIRPSGLSQNSYRDDEVERSHNDEGRHQESGNQYPTQLLSRTGYQTDPGTQQTRVSSVQPDSLVKDVIVCNSSAMDIIALYLDRSLHPGRRDLPLVQRWEHLADEFKVSDSIKMKCGSMSTRISPSERMFQYLRVANHSLRIADLIKHLQKMKRNEVVRELNSNSSLSSDKATVTDLWENNLSTLSTVCIMLDDMHCPNTYKDLATLLRIPRSTLRTFKYEDSGESPSKSVLEILETQRPNLSTDEMIIALTELELTGIAAELLKLPVGSKKANQLPLALNCPRHILNYLQLKIN